MRNSLKSLRSKKAGLPPGSLVYTGAPRAEKASIYAVTYDQSGAASHKVDTIEQALALRGQAARLWINIDGIQDVETVRKCSEAFGIHPLTQEDILNPEQRPKAEQFENFLYVVLRSLSLTKHNVIESEQVSLVLGKDFLISFQEKPGDAFAPILERFNRNGMRLRSEGSDFLLYALIDLIVDRYFEVLERVGDRIDSLLSEVMTSPDPKRLQELNKLKRDGIFLRRSIWPLREMVGMLERGDVRFIQNSTQPFIRDVYSHIVEVMDTVETLRETLANLLDIYLSSLSNRMNTVMKLLTIITTIFMPLTFIAGIYGMNFEHMPELKTLYGYPVVLSVMALIAISMVAFFRKRKWL